MSYVALVQQGAVLDQKVVIVDADKNVALAFAESEAQKLNNAIETETEGWNAVALEVPTT